MGKVPQIFRPIGAGLQDHKHPMLLAPGESPDVQSIEFDRDSVSAEGGHVKLNNQTAPRPGLLTTVGADLLPVLYGKGVPTRGAVAIPWNDKQDVFGGDFAVTKVGNDSLTSRRYAARRGHSGSIKVSFEIPSSEKLYESPTVASAYNDAGNLRTKIGADIGLDECFIVVQKGGEGMTPMSWAFGVVNTGKLFDLDAGVGTNIMGAPITKHVDRASDYALVFMWLDAPGWGTWKPADMRYRLDDGQVEWDEATFPSAANGTYPTHAYRAMVIPKFVEPGRTYHVELQFALDSGTPGTGATPTTAWNDDAVISCQVIEDHGARELFEYDETSPGASTIYHYKGPRDTMAYLGKYGVRYSGKDEMFLGLGYRCAAWTSTGHLYAGIDSAPYENGGFQVTDPSVHARSEYDEREKPLEKPGAGNGLTSPYTLRVAHRANEFQYEINHTGLVSGPDNGSTDWGKDSAIWSLVASFGRHPWGVHNDDWKGCGGSGGSEFNPEVLRGYRLVFQEDTDGVTAEGAGGGVISIANVGTGVVYGAPAYSQADLTAELGLVDITVDFGPGYAINDDFSWTVRAFRWRQRPLIISDFRIYSTVRSYALGAADFSLSHEPDLGDPTEPGSASLVGAWPLSDGAGGIVKDLVLNNAGALFPYAMGVSKLGNEGENQLFLSGEGETLRLDLSKSPVVKEMLRQSQTDGRSGIAIEIKLRIPGASYGIAVRVDSPHTDGNDQYLAKFAPTLAVWGMQEDGLVEPADPTSRSYYAGGFGNKMQPLIEWGHRCLLPWFTSEAGSADFEPFTYPQFFDMKVPWEEDENGSGSYVPGTDLSTGAGSLSSWLRSGASTLSRYGLETSWVGRTITIQFGIQPTDTPELYECYLAYAPAEAIKGAGATATPGTEYQIFEQHIVHRRDVERSVIVVGGGLDPFERAYCEMGRRVLIDGVRVFGVSAPGSLAATGNEVALGTGKLAGGSTYPDRELSADDILVPLGGGAQVVNVVENSKTVLAAGTTAFPTIGPEEDLTALERTFLAIRGDELVLPKEETFRETYPIFHFIDTAAVSALTITTPYQGTTKDAVSAASFRLLGYTAFPDSIADRVLPVGNGKGYTYEGDLDEFLFVEGYYANLAPVGVDWLIAVRAPAGGGSARQMHPRWVRGLAGSRRNEILGITSLEDDLYCAAQGSVFEADDRWRAVGPTSVINRGIDFRATTDPATGLLLPLAKDRCVFTGFTTALLPITAEVVALDTWVNLHEVGPVQTVAWVGREDTDLDLTADLAEVYLWMRLRNGSPELLIGSSGVISAAQPVRGFFRAFVEERLPVGEEVHVRWWVERDGSGILLLPQCSINGKPVATFTAGTEDGLAAGEWLDMANTVALTSSHILALGCGRDASNFPAVRTVEVPPQLIRGWQHSLAGVMNLFAVSTTTLTATDAFQPRGVAYIGGYTMISRILFGDGLGVGHKLYDATRDAYGVIHSSPFVSLIHEMGSGERRFSFATYGREIFCANGGRVAIVEDGAARFAGLLPPPTEADFEFIRTPLFEVNKFDSDGDVDNDAIIQVDTRIAANLDPVYHYRIPGSSFVQQLADSELDWEVDKYFAFKCLFRMNSVQGRIPIYSRRQSLRSGAPFIEIRDGRVYFGWWDVSLKEEQWIRTSKAVIEPGFDYYLNIRVRFPRKGLLVNPNGNPPFNGDDLDVNWENSNYPDNEISTGVGILRNLFIVRRFTKAVQGDVYDDWTGYDIKAAIACPHAADWFTGNSSDRMCVSFTTADAFIPVNGGAGESYTLTGPVAGFTNPGVGAATDQILVAGAGTFVLDHVGMLLQIPFRTSEQSANFDGAIFRIVELISDKEVRVVTQADAAPVFVAGDFDNAPQFMTLVVSPDVALEKSPNFDLSDSPDPDDAVLELFGSQLAQNPLNGVRRFDGVVYSWAFGVFAPTDVDAGGNLNVDADIFEDFSVKHGTSLFGSAEIGTDTFGDAAITPTTMMKLPFAGTGAGQLQVDADRARSAVDVRAYGATGDPTSSQPNENKVITTDAAASTNQNNFTFAGAVQPNGDRLVRMSFHDPKNDVTSRLSAEVTLRPAKDDKSNPSQRLRVRFTNLPVSPDDVDTLLQVWMTTAQGTELFLVAEVESHTHAVEIEINDLFFGTIDKVADFDVGAPPNAAVVGVSQSTMFYADITVEGVHQPDGLMFSKAFEPSVVPFGNIATADTGDSVGITALHDLGRTLVIFKRNAMVLSEVVAIDGISVLSMRRVSGNDGAVSAQSVLQLEGRLYFVSDRGPQVFFGDPDAGPTFLGKRVQTYFDETMDPQYLERISASVNRRRDQYVFTVKDASRFLPDERISIEFDHPVDGDAVNPVIAGHRFSKYRGPSFTALGMVVSKDGGAHDLVGGTRDGFMVWMDRRDTQLSMLGPDEDQWGEWQLKVDAGTDSLFAGKVDEDLEGPRGALLRFAPTGGGAIVEGVLLNARPSGSDYRLVIDTASGQVAVRAVLNADVNLGVLVHRWSTREFDFNMPFLDKQGYFLDVTRPVGVGQLSVDVFRNLAETPTGTLTLLLTEAFASLELGELVQEARSVRLLFYNDPAVGPVDFELLDVTVRAAQTDNR